ncbi:hypothetical protein SDC9_154315 [bioreactor metagenome]|uniref:Uncharacterized protein n=1 Tax=bioreactor metagenome TaxID=1076179 RepID=A0A645F038_9ZZZZ
MPEAQGLQGRRIGFGALIGFTHPARASAAHVEQLGPTSFAGGLNLGQLAHGRFFAQLVGDGAIPLHRGEETTVFSSTLVQSGLHIALAHVSVERFCVLLVAQTCAGATHLACSDLGVSVLNFLLQGIQSAIDLFQLGLLVSAGAASLDLFELLGVLGLELRECCLHAFHQGLDFGISGGCAFSADGHDAAWNGIVLSHDGPFRNEKTALRRSVGWVSC